MAEQSISSVSAIPKDGPSTRRTRKSVKLSQEDEFGILLAQIRECRAAGIEMNWIKSREGAIVLVIPALRTCENRHLYITEACPHCKTGSGIGSGIQESE